MLLTLTVLIPLAGALLVLAAGKQHRETAGQRQRDERRQNRQVHFHR